MMTEDQEEKEKKEDQEEKVKIDQEGTRRSKTQEEKNIEEKTTC